MARLTWWGIGKSVARAAGVVVLASMPATASAQTQNLNLAWNANPEPDIASYYVHVGTSSGNYNIAVTPVPANQQTYAFPATPGVRYYFAVKAVNTAGAWSPSSAEVVGGVPTFTQPSNRTGTVGTLITPVQLSAADPDGGTLQFSASNLPAGLSISTSGRITGTPTTVQTRNVTVSVFDGTVTVQRSFTWTINPGPATVSAVSVSPSSGSGTSQTFALQYSDSLGALDLGTAWAWFSTTLTSSSSNSCMVYYNRVANLLYLLNDAGSMWLSATLGTATTLQNSQCAVNVGSSVATVSGNTLTLNLPINFRPAYSGAKHVYLYAASTGGSNSGWQDRGDWTIPSVTTSVTADSATPSSGSGASQNFAIQYSSSVGATDLATTWVWFNETFASTSANSCMVYYNRSANTLFLLNDGGSSWQPASMGAAVSLENSQCAIAVGDSTAVVNGTALTLNLSVTFAPSFAGSKNIYTYATNGIGTNSGWQDRGDWTVPTGGSSAAPSVTADSASPATGTGSSQPFTLQFSDSMGGTNLGTAWVWFSSSFGSTSSNSCMAYYNRGANTVFLLNDAGSVWQPATLGTSTTLQNSQCAIAVGSSSATTSGTALTLNLTMSFKPAFAGAKNIYLYAANSTGTNSGWHDRGDWTVPNSTAAVTADSATPSSGSGATQTFALQYSDPLGAADLNQAWVWFTGSFGSNSADSCMLYYQRSTSTLYLLNDGASVWQPATLGTSGTLQNSQCAVNLGGSAAVISGTTLTLNLSVTFKPAYSGAKQIYMYANGLGSTASGWQDRGDWTAP